MIPKVIKTPAAVNLDVCDWLWPMKICAANLSSCRRCRCGKYYNVFILFISVWIAIFSECGKPIGG
jgi:hypothetical protein